MNQLKNTLEKFLTPQLLLTLAGLVVVVALFFEFSPTVGQARLFISEEDLSSKGVDCYRVLSARPWSGKFNPWTVIWFVMPPLLIFSLKPRAHWFLHFTTTLGAALFSWFSISRQIFYYWMVRNDVFSYHSNTTWTNECINIADGASMLFYPLLGFPVAFYYVGLWLMFWINYHRFLDNEAFFSLDYLSKVLIVIVKFWPLTILIVSIILFFVSLIFYYEINSFFNNCEQFITFIKIKLKIS